MLTAAKMCDSCKSATATVFCRADSAYLCISCDCKIHAANKLASRHARVWVCEVCEHAPASVTCKADAAHLCSTCDRDIHSANPLARRHDRVPLTPFFDSSQEHSANTANADAAAKSAAMSKLFGDDYYSDADADAEAASWLDNPKGDNVNYLLPEGDDMDPYLDLDPKPDPSSDGLVPDPDHSQQHYSIPATVTGASHYQLDGYDHGKPAAFSLAYNPATQPASLSHSVSSSSLDYGVVPDATISSGMVEGVSATVTLRSGLGHEQEQEQIKMMGMDREARVLRYREKRKNRRFEKTIRYASRKAYAETRPRIKGRFAKRTQLDPGYGVVPSF